MSQAWKMQSLHSVGVSLIDCDHRTPPATDVGYPYIAIPQLRNGHIHLAGVRRITQAHYQEWTRKALPRLHDVVLSRRCNPGETAVVPKGLQCALGQNLVLLRANGPGLCPPFLRWLVRGPEWWDEVRKHINVGAVFDSLKCRDIPNFELPVPPVAEQIKIAHVLDALDDKIELNRRTNETLEGMARALFKSWFVDFDPVHAKKAGRKPVGMDAATAALFPSSFEESALGPVPKGWMVTRLGDLMELKRGYDLPTAQRAPGRVPIVSSSGPSGTHDQPMAQPPGVVTGRYGTIGKVFFVREPFWPLNTTLYARDFKGQDPQYAFHLLSLVDFTKFSDKGAVPGINRNHVHEELVVAAPSAIQSSFGKIATCFMDSVSITERETMTLTALRDALLPKLLSGELRVPEAERLVGKAV